MKWYLCIVFIIFLTFIWFCRDSSEEDLYLSTEEKIVNTIIGDTARIIKKKYKLNPCGSGAG